MFTVGIDDELDFDLLLCNDDMLESYRFNDAQRAKSNADMQVKRENASYAVVPVYNGDIPLRQVNDNYNLNDVPKSQLEEPNIDLAVFMHHAKGPRDHKCLYYSA